MKLDITLDLLLFPTNSNMFLHVIYTVVHVSNKILRLNSN